MGELWSVVLGAGLTAVAGLIGLLVNQRREHMQWLRNEKLEAYTEFVRQYLDVQRSMIATVYGHPNTENEFTEKTMRLIDLQVSLVSSRDVSFVQQEMTEFLGGVLTEHRNRNTPYTDKEIEDIQEADRSLVRKVQAEMRKDLRIKWSKFKYATEVEK